MQFFQQLRDMDDHSIILWTLVFTAAGVIAGLIVLYLTWRAVRETRLQSEKNTETTRAEFLLQLRQAFGSHIEAHINLRPGGIWHDSTAAPSCISDYAKIELYMGLFEYCDELLEKDFLDNTAFSRQYRYRVQNLLTNHWVVSQKLMAARPGWLGFINLCHRLEIRNIPTVKPLSTEEMAELYPTHRRKRFSLLGS